MANVFIDDPRVISAKLACAIGTNECFIVSQLHYWLQFAKTTHEGKKWVYNTYEQWHELLPFISIMTIRRAIKKLESQNLIYVKQLSSNKINRTNYYTINYKEIDSICSTGTNPIVQVEQTHMFKENTSIHKGTHKGTHKHTDDCIVENKKMTKFSDTSKELGVEGILKVLKDKKAKLPTAPKVLKPQAVLGWWVDLCRFLHNETAYMGMKKPTGAQNGMMNQIITHTDGRVIAVLSYITQEWAQFKMQVFAVTGESIPVVPNLNVLVKNIHIAIALFDEQGIVESNKEPSDSKVPVGLIDKEGKEGW